MKTNTIAIIAASSAFFLLCMVMFCKQTPTKKTIAENELPPLTEISQTPKIEHGVNCDCDSLFGYKECDDINFGGYFFRGNGSIWDSQPCFYFERTTLTNTPYIFVIQSKKGLGTQNLIDACYKNVPNFHREWKHGSVGHYYYDIEERLLKLLPTPGGYEIYLGTKDNKEYFLIHSTRLRDGQTYYDDTKLYITDLNLLKQENKEKYNSEAPKREKEAQEKLLREKNSEIFPI